MQSNLYSEWRFGVKNGAACKTRTYDPRITNNRARVSGIYPQAGFDGIFRHLTSFIQCVGILNFPGTSVHDYTGITHGPPHFAAPERVHIALRPVPELGKRQRHQLRQAACPAGKFLLGHTIHALRSVRQRL